LDKIEKPLAGKRIIVTRAPEQAQELIHALERLGAEVLLLPTVRFVAASDWKVFDGALKKIAEFDWILLTSQNSVRFVCQHIRESGVGCELVQSPRPLVAAVGPATARAATAEGLRVDHIGQNHTGVSLVREISGLIHGRKVLLPRSDRGDDRLTKALREAGAVLTEFVAYRTMAPDALDPGILFSLRNAEVNAIIFASPSAFDNLLGFVGSSELAKISKRVQFAGIGPTTARALRKAGSGLAIEAEESSAAGLADAIAKYYQRQRTTVRHT
jgi:uroporphyrinogen-III synthase